MIQPDTEHPSLQQLQAPIKPTVSLSLPRIFRKSQIQTKICLEKTEPLSPIPKIHTKKKAEEKQQHQTTNFSNQTPQCIHSKDSRPKRASIVASNQTLLQKILANSFEKPIVTHKRHQTSQKVDPSPGPGSYNLTQKSVIQERQKYKPSIYRLVEPTYTVPADTVSDLDQRKVSPKRPIKQPPPFGFSGNRISHEAVSQGEFNYDPSNSFIDELMKKLGPRPKPFNTTEVREPFFTELVKQANDAPFMDPKGLGFQGRLHKIGCSAMKSSEKREVFEVLDQNPYVGPGSYRDEEQQVRMKSIWSKLAKKEHFKDGMENREPFQIKVRQHLESPEAKLLLKKKTRAKQLKQGATFGLPRKSTFPFEQ